MAGGTQQDRPADQIDQLVWCTGSWPWRSPADTSTNLKSQWHAECTSQQVSMPWNPWTAAAGSGHVTRYDHSVDRRE